jgi:hypothetical protein
MTSFAELLKQHGLLSLEHISTKPWSDYKESDYTLTQWHNACLIHQHDGPPTSKSDDKLPVKTPDGVLNKNGVIAAAAALAGARGGVDATTEQKTAAKKALIGYYNQMNMPLPASLQHSDVDEFLTHHGIKGQRWGVRRENPSGGSSKPTRTEKKIAKLDAGWEKSIGRANQAKLDPRFHNELVGRINRAVDDLNSSDKYRDVDLSTYHGALKDQYEKDAQAAIVRAMEDATRSFYGHNLSGTKRAVYNSKTDQIDIVDVPKPPVSHADTQTSIPDFTIQLHRNSIGLIDSISIVSVMQQSALEFTTEFLSHFGRKGMKWGQHIFTRDKVVGPTKTKEPVSEDHAHVSSIASKAKSSGVQSLSNKDLQDAIKRMNLENDFARLSSGTKNKGATWTKKFLLNVGQQQAQQAANQIAAKQVAKFLAKAAVLG